KHLLAFVDQRRLLPCVRQTSTVASTWLVQGLEFSHFSPQFREKNNHWLRMQGCDRHAALIADPPSLTKGRIPQELAALDSHRFGRFAFGHFVLHSQTPGKSLPSRRQRSSYESHCYNEPRSVVLDEQLTNF